MIRLSRAVVFSALILSGYSSASFAAAYLFLKTPPQPVPGIDLPGTLNVPANALGGTHVTSQVFLLKPGTEGLPDECLDQGDQNRVGVGANALGAPVTISSTTAGYTLTLSVDASATASSCVSGNPVPIRVASIAGAGIPDGTWTGTYDVYQPGSVPEPGTLALLGLGLSALVFVKRRQAGRG
mgnify:CR=1 FL=1